MCLLPYNKILCVWYTGVCGIWYDVMCVQFKLWPRGVTCVVYRGVWYTGVCGIGCDLVCMQFKL